MPSLKYFLSTEQEAFLATRSPRCISYQFKGPHQRWSFLTAVRKVLGLTHCGQEVRCACWPGLGHRHTPCFEKIPISSPQITWNRCPQEREALLPQENRRCQPNKEQIPLCCLQSCETAWGIFLSVSCKFGHITILPNILPWPPRAYKIKSSSF